MEKSLDNLKENITEELLHKLKGNISKKDCETLIQALLLLYKEEEQKKSLEFVEPPKNSDLKQTFTEQDSDNLIFNELVVDINRTIKLYYNNEDKSFFTYCGKEKIIFQLALSEKEHNNLKSKYKNHSFLFCKADIVYSDTLEIFSLHFLKIFLHKESLKKYIELLQGKNIAERIDILLKILGLNSNNMLYHEKMIAIERLVPLIVKKHLTLEISKKEIGKTHTYSSLDFTPHILLLTRANTFINGRNKKVGSFFSEDIVFIIDEISKINDSEIITAIQGYMNGNKHIGKIQTTGNDLIEVDTSIVILGNFKIPIDPISIFLEEKNIFKNTVIMESPDGEAFVSRINSLLNSWGCRTFSPLIKIDNTEESFYNFSFLKEVIIELRDKTFDVENFYSLLNINWCSPSNRAHESVEKNFEGLIKLIFPEFINNISSKDIDKHYNEFLFLYERAVEMRSVVDSQLKIINPSDNKKSTFKKLTSSLRGILFDIQKSHLITPHRIIIDLGEIIKKIPLDTVGIEQNKAEIKLIENYEKNSDYYFDNSLGILEHDDYYDYNTLKNIYKSSNFWSNKINYNYLTGEYEHIEDSNLSNFIFYDLEIR